MPIDGGGTKSSSVFDMFDTQGVPGPYGRNFTFETIKQGYSDWLGPSTNVIVLEKPPPFTSVEDADAWMAERAS